MKEQSNDFVFLMARILGTYGSSWAAFDILDIGNHNLKAFEPRHAKLFHCQPEQKLAQAFLFPSAEPNLKTRPIIRPENSGYNLNVVVDLCVLCDDLFVYLLLLTVKIFFILQSTPCIATMNNVLTVKSSVDTSEEKNTPV